MRNFLLDAVRWICLVAFFVGFGLLTVMVTFRAREFIIAYINLFNAPEWAALMVMITACIIFAFTFWLPEYLAENKKRRKR